MKKIFALLLMLVAISSFAQKSKFVWGYFIELKLPSVVYYNGINKSCFDIDKGLYELENMKIRQIMNVRFSDEKGYVVTYNPKEGYFILEY